MGNLVVVEHVQTKREISALLAAAGLKPLRRLGQHFLIDGNLMRRMAAEGAPGPDDLILEVGGGTGGLTDLLAGRAARLQRPARLLCVEIDPGLHAILTDRFADSAGVTVILGDVLEQKHRLMTEVAKHLRAYESGPTGPSKSGPAQAEACGSAQSESGQTEACGSVESGSGKTEACGSVKLVANLPYQVAAPLVMNLLVDYPQVRRLCFTVQAEVGERILAVEGCKEYGPLSVLSQALATTRVIANISPQSFWPRPAVASVMLRMDVKDRPLETVGDVRSFASLVRETFCHRRKTLRGALAYVLENEQRERVCRLVDASRRPESFSVTEWLEMFRSLQGM